MRGMTRRRTRLAHPPAKLSVVVPVYDVEPYLAECLDSILVQSFHALEVVVVDDGSTDGSGRIADEYSRRDSRVRVLHQDNAGLGAARNRGIESCGSEYLAFADSDDLVPPGAYAALVRSLERTGSDLAIGAVQRMNGDNRFMTPLMRENHRQEKLSTNLDEMPGMLADVFAWNKVFSRRFWDAHTLSFPERVRYEDQPTLTKALVEAGSFDVLADSVYLWRVRGDGTSISQGRHELDDLSDRILTKRWSTELVRKHTTAVVQRVWYEKVLPIDMWEYFRAVPGCSGDYWRVLRDGVRELWNDDTVPFAETLLPPRQRLMGWLVSQDRRSDLERLLRYLDESPEGGTKRGRPGGFEHPFLDDPGLPPSLRGEAGNRR